MGVRQATSSKHSAISILHASTHWLHTCMHANITLHYITLRCIALHYITFSTTLQDIALHDIHPSIHPSIRTYRDTVPYHITPKLHTLRWRTYTLSHLYWTCSGNKTCQMQLSLHFVANVTMVSSESKRMKIFSCKARCVKPTSRSCDKKSTASRCKPAVLVNSLRKFCCQRFSISHQVHHHKCNWIHNLLGKTWDFVLFMPYHDHNIGVLPLVLECAWQACRLPQKWKYHDTEKKLNPKWSGKSDCIRDLSVSHLISMGEKPLVRQVAEQRMCFNFCSWKVRDSTVDPKRTALQSSSCMQLSLQIFLLWSFWNLVSTLLLFRNCSHEIPQLLREAPKKSVSVSAMVVFVAFVVVCLEHASGHAMLTVPHSKNNGYPGSWVRLWRANLSLKVILYIKQNLYLSVSYNANNQQSNNNSPTI